MSWPIVALGEVAEIVSGATPKTSTAEYWDGEIAWATPKDLSGLNGKYLIETPRNLTEAGLKSCAAKLLPERSVLFSSRAPIGHVAINTKPMATNQGFKSMIPGPKLSADFLYWWLRANRSAIERLGSGATFKEVSKAVVSRIEIPLPPLDEQKRIAAILDKADALRRAQRKAADLLNRLAVSRFRALFGDPSSNAQRYPLRAFGEVFRDETSKSPKVQRGDYKASGRFPVVDQGKSLVAGWVDDERLLNGSALPVVIFGDHTKAVKFVDFEFCTGADGAKVLAVQEGWDARHAATLLSLMPIPDLGYSRHMREVKRLQFPQPPLQDQQHFGAWYSGVSERIAVFERRESRLNALFDSIQNRAFAGKL